jgi:AbiV family abortive infection protein
MSFKMTRDKICEGMKLALKKCDDHLSSVEILISKGALDDAVVLIEFAIEEFGRAVWLSEKLKTGSTNVEKKLQFDHKFKYDKAWLVLPEGLKTIYLNSFDVTAFSGVEFDTGKETISPMTRLDATYVNYSEKTQQWKTGIRADAKKLLEIVEGIRKCMQQHTW